MRRTVALVSMLALAGTARAAETLTVSFASSFRDVGAVIVERFEQAHPGLDVSVNNGPSGMLARQIEDGAPVDVFVSAGWPEIDRLRDKKLIAGEPLVVAKNRLVVVVPVGSPWIGRDPRALLTSPEVIHVASGDPATVPFGAYAKQALTAAGLWEQIEPKLVLASEVRQALTYADQKSVDAAIVYATDAKIAKEAVLLGEVPGSQGLKIETIAVRTTRATAPAAAAFLAELTSAASRETLRAAGFGLPGS
jgi:molybdate transport system substrate-binding protein